MYVLTFSLSMDGGRELLGQIECGPLLLRVRIQIHFLFDDDWPYYCNTWVRRVERRRAVCEVGD